MVMYFVFYILNCDRQPRYFGYQISTDIEVMARYYYPLKVTENSVFQLKDGTKCYISDVKLEADHES
jgi:hypothetical protein